MKILLANPRGFCAGVDRAIKIVELALDVYGRPVYVRKEIVHNSHVVRELRERGAVFVDELSEVPAGSRTILSAHGVSPSVYSEAKSRQLEVIDATCPLVTKVHLEVQRFVKQGFHIILIGHDGHDEVIGTRGYAPVSITLVENEEQAATVVFPQTDRLMVLTQTTLGVEDTQGVINVLKSRFAKLQLPPTDDICYATQNRQDAVKAMCGRGMDLLLVVGSRNSSNAARLVEVGRARGVSGYLIDGADDIDPDWLQNAETVGVSAGASTPEPIVRGVLERLASAGADTVEPITTAIEDTEFQIPVSLRDAIESRGLSGTASGGFVALRVENPRSESN